MMGHGGGGDGLPGKMLEFGGFWELEVDEKLVTSRMRMMTRSKSGGPRGVVVRAYAAR